MTATVAQLEEWLRGRENEHLEFKEARNNFHFDRLVKYCAALANEGGGVIILGVTDRPPRRVVGSSAFPELERTKAGLIDRLRLRVDACELAHEGGRVLVFTAPSRPVGMPVAVDGAYWMRAGEELVPMTPDMLQRIFAEAAPDFSAEVCVGATTADLDGVALNVLRRLWAARSGNPQVETRAVDALLRDAELLVAGGVTYAASSRMSSRSPRSMWKTTSSNPMPRSALSLALLQHVAPAADDVGAWFAFLSALRAVIELDLFIPVLLVLHIEPARSYVDGHEASASESPGSPRGG